MLKFLDEFFIQSTLDFFRYKFLFNALLAGLIVGLTCSILSVYVVLKRLAFIGLGISHAALGGIALGLLLFQVGQSSTIIPVYITALIFCVAIAIFISAITRNQQVSLDSAIGIFFSFSMALGIILFSLQKKYSSDLFSYLFGSIIAVTNADLMIMLILGIIILLTVVLFYKELFYYLFDEEMAYVSGIPVTFIHYLLITLISLTIVLSVRIIGIILISAFLVIPGATAQILTADFKKMMIASITVGIFSSILGLMFANSLSIPSGSSIVVVLFIIFIIVLIIKKII